MGGSLAMLGLVDFIIFMIPEVPPDLGSGCLGFGLRKTFLELSIGCCFCTVSMPCRPRRSSGHHDRSPAAITWYGGIRTLLNPIKNRSASQKPGRASSRHHGHFAQSCASTADLL